jgi:hypothetical protein
VVVVVAAAAALYHQKESEAAEEEDAVAPEVPKGVVVEEKGEKEEVHIVFVAALAAAESLVLQESGQSDRSSETVEVAVAVGHQVEDQVWRIQEEETDEEVLEVRFENLCFDPAW